MPVAQPAAAAFFDDDALTVFEDLADEFVSVCVTDHGADGHLHHFVASVGSEGTGCGGRRHPCPGFDVPLEAEVLKGPQVGIALDDHIGRHGPAVAAVRAAFGDVFLPTQVRAAGSAVAGGHVDLDVIDKIALCHGLVCFLSGMQKYYFFRCVICSG